MGRASLPGSPAVASVARNLPEATPAAEEGVPRTNVGFCSDIPLSQSQPYLSTRSLKPKRTASSSLGYVKINLSLNCGCNRSVALKTSGPFFNSALATIGVKPAINAAVQYPSGSLANE